MKTVSAVWLVAVLYASCALLQDVSAGTDPIVIKDYFMFHSDSGERFLSRGVAYYPRPNAGDLDENNLDFFTSDYSQIWERDLEYMSDLGVNTIRIYAVDPSQNHDEFMCACSKHGIYVMVGIAAQCEGCAITKDDAPACYPASLKTRAQMIINVFSKYPNVIGFSAGNEVNHVATPPAHNNNAVCQKALIRDMRKFVDNCHRLGMRKVPVGVVSADYDRKAFAAYYNCQTSEDSMERAEFYGLNSYLHCDASVTTYSKAAGMKNLLEDFRSLDYSVPLLLTEYGCVNPSFPDGQRTWHQAKWLLGPEMNEYFSGGVVFEYSTEMANSFSTSGYPPISYGPQNYGLVYFSPQNCNDIDIPCKVEKQINYFELQQVYRNLQPSGMPSLSSFSASQSRKKANSCPAGFQSISSFSWPEVEDQYCWVSDPPTCFDTSSPTKMPTVAPIDSEDSEEGSDTGSKNGENSEDVSESTDSTDGSKGNENEDESKTSKDGSTDGSDPGAANLFSLSTVPLVFTAAIIFALVL